MTDKTDSLNNKIGLIFNDEHTEVIAYRRNPESPEDPKVANIEEFGLEIPYPPICKYPVTLLFFTGGDGVHYAGHFIADSLPADTEETRTSILQQIMVAADSEEEAIELWDEIRSFIITADKFARELAEGKAQLPKGYEAVTTYRQTGLTDTPQKRLLFSIF